MMNRFFGHKSFDLEERKQLKAKWNKMSDTEKLEFMNKKMEAFDNPHAHFSVESVDECCEKWMNMSQAEKEAFVEKHREIFAQQARCGSPFSHHFNTH